MSDRPGHDSELHSCVSRAGPKLEQSNPPRDFPGVVHFLDLSCVPPPQVAEHLDHLLQSAYAPVAGVVSGLTEGDSMNVSKIK